MPYCPKCSSTVNEQDNFCNKCGTNLNNPLNLDQKKLSIFGFPFKASTNFANGTIIGVSAAILAISLLLWSSLDSTYWNQRSFLILQGIKPSAIESILLRTVGEISLCSAAVVYASYVLINSTLSQFIVAVRILIDNKENRTRVGNGLIVGGVLAITFAVQDMVFYSYPLASSAPPNFQLDFGVGGAIIIFMGVLMLISSYLKSRKLATKFKEQKQ